MKLVGMSLAAVAVIFCLPSQSHAALVQQSLTGVVSGGDTTDTYGIFGTAGANLAGQKITIYFQYNSAQFKAALNCGTNCTYYNTSANANLAGSVLLVASIGTQVVYAPSSIGQVEFQNSTAEYPANFLSLGSDGALAGTSGATTAISYTSGSALGDELAPKNKAVLNNHDSPDIVTFYTANGNYETIEFYLTKATN